MCSSDLSQRFAVSGGVSLTGNALETFDKSNGIDLRQRYLVVAPQLSGYYITKAAANFRVSYSGMTMPDTMAAFEYDLYYIKHLSPRLDAYITILSLRPR